MKPGRKKGKKGTEAVEVLTPRTRGALAREAAAKARREAEEAELKAAAAREAAELAARAEIEATRNEFATYVNQQEGLEDMALQVVAPETSITARRY